MIGRLREFKFHKLFDLIYENFHAELHTGDFAGEDLKPCFHSHRYVLQESRFSSEIFFLNYDDDAQTRILLSPTTCYQHSLCYIGVM